MWRAIPPPGNIFSLNHQVGSDCGSRKEFCQYSFTCFSVFLIVVLSRSDPVAHTYLF